MGHLNQLALWQVTLEGSAYTLIGVVSWGQGCAQVMIMMIHDETWSWNEDLQQNHIKDGKHIMMRVVIWAQVIT